MMAYDLRGVSSIVDIGGGEGKLLRKILELNPEMRGAVLECPRPSKQQVNGSGTMRAVGDVHTSQEILDVGPTGSRRVPSLWGGP